MWNAEAGQMRCANDHVFAVTMLGAKETKVVRVDRPSTWERLSDYALGIATGCMLTILTLAASGIL
jgi:hypothetical protein